MPLYRCTKCGCVENTAIGYYYGRAEPVCTECETGSWHDHFDKKSSEGYFVDRSGYLWKDQNNIGYNTKIVGIIQNGWVVKVKD